MDKGLELLLGKCASMTKEKLGQSTCFLGILSPSFEKDPQCLIQLATCILLDKPIFLLVTGGQKVPNHLRAIAAHIEYAKDSDDDEAIERLSEVVKRFTMEPGAS